MRDGEEVSTFWKKSYFEKKKNTKEKWKDEEVYGRRDEGEKEIEQLMENKAR